MKLGTAEYSIIKILLSLDTMMTVADCARALTRIRKQYNLGGVK